MDTLPARLSRRKLLAAGMLAVAGCGGGSDEERGATRWLQPGDQWRYAVTQVRFQVTAGAAVIPGAVPAGDIRQVQQGSATLAVTATERSSLPSLWYTLHGDFAIDERREVHQDPRTGEVVTLAFGCSGEDPACRRALEEPLPLLPARWYAGQRFLYPTVDGRPSEAFVREQQTVDTPQGSFTSWRVEVDTNSGTRYDYLVSMLYLVPSLGAWALREDSRISAQTGEGTLTTFRLTETTIAL